MKRKPLYILLGYFCYRFPSTGRHLWSIYTQFQTKKYSVINHVDKTYSDKSPVDVVYVDPNNIKYYEKSFDFDKRCGRVVGGDWDRELKTFEDNKVFECLQKRFSEGYDWNEIEYVQNCIKDVDKGCVVWQNCTSTAEIHDHCKDVDKLYRSIAEHGMLEPVELLEQGKAVRPHNIPKVNVGRDGELILNSDGTHRTALGKILNVDEMPVWINVRHERWQAIRAQIAKGGDVPPEYADHPDLGDLISA